MMRAPLTGFLCLLVSIFFFNAAFAAALSASDALVNGKTVLDSDIPTPRFDASPMSGTFPLRVYFTDLSTGNIKGCRWDFGDSETSRDRNSIDSYLNPGTHSAIPEEPPQVGMGAIHSYRNPGIYSVTLTVTGPDGEDYSLTKPDLIFVTDPSIPPPVADFGLSPSEDNVPLKVIFTDGSSGEIKRWSWDFGDGSTLSTDTGDNPTHTYSAPGLYNVTLTVRGPGGEHSKMNSITLPDADFTADRVSGNFPLEVHFFDASTGSPTTWQWDFGDGGTSTEQNPKHVYEKAGEYNVALTVKADGLSVPDSESKPSYITVSHPPPVASFKASGSSRFAPRQITFVDQSTGTISKSTWEFGDGEGWSWDSEEGEGTTDRNPPLHVFKYAGNYKVILTVEGPGGKNDFSKTFPVKPRAAFKSKDSTSGDVPLTVNFKWVGTNSIDPAQMDAYSFMWDFGDGDNSADRNPTHTYSKVGKFTATLTITGPDKDLTDTRKDYITVNPHVDFSAGLGCGLNAFSVQFNDHSTGNVTARQWDFGDGQTSIEQNPVHHYDKAGKYNVKLTIRGDWGLDTDTKSVEKTIDLTDGKGVSLGTGNFSYQVPPSNTKLSPWKPLNADGPLDGAPVLRMTVHWGGFEPVEGRFKDGTTDGLATILQPGKLRDLIEYEVTDHIVLGIRAMSNEDGFWALKEGAKAGLSYPPRDLKDEYSDEDGYSHSYYTFVRHLMETISGLSCQRRGQDERSCADYIEAIVVENEMNSTQFFIGNVSEYCRMAATARKAVKDVRPDVKVYCGGLQGGAVVWTLITRYLAEESRRQDALQLYNDAFPKDQTKVRNSLEKLQEMASKKIKKACNAWVKEVLEDSPLYGGPKNPGNIQGLPLDGLNFHDYRPSQAFDRISTDLRLYTNLPVVSNETGIYVPPKDPNRYETAQKEMVKKLTKAKFYVDEFATWYSGHGEDEETAHAGGFTDPKFNLIDGNVNVFKFLTEKIDRPEEIRKANLSQCPNGIQRFEFVYPDRIVRVVWNEGSSDYEENIPEGAVAYNILGVEQQARDGKVVLTSGVPCIIETFARCGD